MITALFTHTPRGVSGFQVNGHSGLAPSGSDIVCAAVSSAVYLAANTITDVIGLAAVVREHDGHLTLTLPQGQEDGGSAVLAGLRLHLKQLQSQYPGAVRVIDCKWRKSHVKD